MQLFLAGGGGREDSLELDKKFAAAIDKSKPLIYLPIAMNGKYSYPSCFDWISKTLNPLGVNHIDLWTETDLSNEIDINKYAGIFIGGGNTFYLLDQLKQSGFISQLTKVAKLNFPIYGGSAGAIILGKTIITSGDENQVGLADLSALNLIDDSHIKCHYHPDMDSQLNELVTKLKTKIIAIPENAGIIVSETIQEVGPGKVKYFN